jgi:hypothetical protein
MANENLISLADRTTEEQHEIATKGGIASGIARNKKKLLRECLEELLNKEMKDKNGNTASGAEVLATKLFQQALQGNIKAFEVVRDTAGQKPAERVVVSNIDPDVINQVERMVNDDL